MHNLHPCHPHNSLHLCTMAILSMCLLCPYWVGKIRSWYRLEESFSLCGHGGTSLMGITMWFKESHTLCSLIQIHSHASSIDLLLPNIPIFLCSGPYQMAKPPATTHGPYIFLLQAIYMQNGWLCSMHEVWITERILPHYYLSNHRQAAVPVNLHLLTKSSYACTKLSLFPLLHQS